MNEAVLIRKQIMSKQLFQNPGHGCFQVFDWLPKSGLNWLRQCCPAPDEYPAHQRMLPVSKSTPAGQLLPNADLCI
jgi:hypothetical protein